MPTIQNKKTGVEKIVTEAEWKRIQASSIGKLWSKKKDTPVPAELAEIKPPAKSKRKATKQKAIEEPVIETGVEL